MDSLSHEGREMNEVKYKDSNGKVLKFSKFTINGASPASFYVFERGDGSNYRECYWSGWITGDINLYHKLKNLEKKDIKTFMEVCDDLAKIRH